MGARILNRRLNPRRNAGDFEDITSPGELSYSEASNLQSLLHHLGIHSELRRDGEVVAVRPSAWGKAFHFYRQAVIDGLVKQQTASNRGRRRSNFLRFSAHQLPNGEYRIVDNLVGDTVRVVKTKSAAIQAVASMNARDSRYAPYSSRRREQRRVS